MAAITPISLASERGVRLADIETAQPARRMFLRLPGVRLAAALVLASLAASLAWLVVSVAAPAAVAGTVQGIHGGDEIEYQAAPGEANKIVATRAPGVIRIVDMGATVTAVGDCVSVNEHEAVCSVSDVFEFWVYAGDRDDSVVIEGPINSRVDGQEGNDVLEGGDYADYFDGGPGNDTLKGVGAPGSANSLYNPANVLYGGEGDDYLDGYAGGEDVLDGAGGAHIIRGDKLDWTSYANRLSGVTVTLDGIANDGETGERDNVQGNPRVQGSSHGDTLIGNASSNRLFGGGGSDVLKGGRGGDFLDGQAGSDVIQAGGGPRLPPGRFRKRQAPGRIRSRPPVRRSWVGHPHGWTRARPARRRQGPGYLPGARRSAGRGPRRSRLRQGESRPPSRSCPQHRVALLTRTTHRTLTQRPRRHATARPTASVVAAIWGNRAGRTRTCNPRFWRPVLCQLSYGP